MSEETDDLSRLREAFAAGSDAAPRWTCPPSEKLWDGAAGKLPPGELRDLVEHLASCAACAEDWRIAAGWSREAALAAPPVTADVARHPFARPRLWLAAAAAAAALAIGVPLAFHWGEPPPPVYREGAQQEIRSRLAAGEALPRERCLLRWDAVPKAASYDVLVSTEALALLANPKNLATPELLVPAATLAGLPAGTRLAWQVTANLEGGGQLRSQTFLTEIR